jgi:hypothetical protein
MINLYKTNNVTKHKTIMKKITTLLLLLSIAMSAQNQRVCGTEAPDYDSPLLTAKTLHDSDPSTIYVVNVFFHIINYSDGTSPAPSGISYGETQVLEAVRDLNVGFNPHKIYFKYIGFDVKNNSVLTNTANSTNLIASGIKTGCFNLYFAKNVVAGDAWGMFGNTISAFSYYALETQHYSTLIHEIGHNMRLLHTFNGSDDATNCEHVTRVAGPNYNAATAGDQVTDTPAQFNAGASRYNSDCEYIYDAAYMDCQGTAYVNLEPNNYMSYDDTPGCIYHFTALQAKRMRDYLENTTFEHYKACYNTIESLYEPFAIVGVGGTQNGGPVVSKTYTPNENNTGVNIWNCPIFTLRFQTGLTYEFSNSTIGTLIKTPEQQYNYIINNQPVNVKIPAINDDMLQSGGINCFTSYEPYIKGDVKSMTNLGSSVIYYETLDEVKASDPNLYDLLTSQQYHVITKETESGYTDQKMIYKN